MSRKLNHPNVVRFLGTFRSQSDAYLVMEFVPKGSLVDFLRKQDVKTELNTTDLVKMCLDACSGLLFLEQKGIVVSSIVLVSIDDVSIET